MGPGRPNGGGLRGVPLKTIGVRKGFTATGLAGICVDAAHRVATVVMSFLLERQGCGDLPESVEAVARVSGVHRCCDPTSQTTAAAPSTPPRNRTSPGSEKTEVRRPSLHESRGQLTFGSVWTFVFRSGQ